MLDLFIDMDITAGLYVYVMFLLLPRGWHEDTT